MHTQPMVCPSGELVHVPPESCLVQDQLRKAPLPRACRTSAAQLLPAASPGPCSASRVPGTAAAWWCLPAWCACWAGVSRLSSWACSDSRPLMTSTCRARHELSSHQVQQQAAAANCSSNKELHQLHLRMLPVQEGEGCSQQCQTSCQQSTMLSSSSTSAGMTSEHVERIGQHVILWATCFALSVCSAWAVSRVSDSHRLAS